MQSQAIRFSGSHKYLVVHGRPDRQIMIEEQYPRGINFFDFINEVWRTKWVFLAILIGVAVPAYFGLTFVGKNDQRKKELTETEQIRPPVYYGHFVFSLNLGADPFGRLAPPLIADLKSKLAKIDKFGLVNEEDIFTGDSIPKYRFLIRDTRPYGGRVYLKLSDGSLELAEQIRDEFIEAAKVQFEATKSQTNADLEKLREIIANAPTLKSDLIVQKTYDSIHFLTDQKVQDGSFRFFEFSPVATSPPAPPKPPPPNEIPSPKKNIIVALMLGLALASITTIVLMTVRETQNRSVAAKRSDPASSIRNVGGLQA